MTEPELIEAMAVNMYQDGNVGVRLLTWDNLSEGRRYMWRQRARAALSAIKAEGCKVMERPTPPHLIGASDSWDKAPRVAGRGKVKHVAIGPLSVDAKDRECRVGGRVVGLITWERFGVYALYSPRGTLWSEHRGLEAAKKAAEKRWGKP